MERNREDKVYLGRTVFVESRYEQVYKRGDAVQFAPKLQPVNQLADNSGIEGGGTGAIEVVCSQKTVAAKVVGRGGTVEKGNAAARAKGRRDPCEGFETILTPGIDVRGDYYFLTARATLGKAEVKERGAQHLEMFIQY
jgi:hypothetical protein